MKQMLYNPKFQAACPVPFDEAKLWKGQSGPELKQKIQRQFRNIRYLLKFMGLTLAFTKYLPSWQTKLLNWNFVVA